VRIDVAPTPVYEGIMHRPAVILLLSAALAACTAAKRNPDPAPVVSGRPLVAVVPFRTGGGLDESGKFVPGSDPAAVPEGAGEEAARVLSQRLAGARIATVDFERVLAATPPPGAAVYDAKLGSRIARKVGANLAVIGAVARYVEREGSALGVTTPASIAYQLVLVRASDGALFTVDRFDHTQQPLTSNLLDLPTFLRAGGRWMTRQEMLEGALGETAQKLAKAVRAGGGS
jgi:hypothetical protein